MSILDQFFSDNNQPLDAEHIRHCREMAESPLSTVSVVRAHNEHGESEDFDPLFWAIKSLMDESLRMRSRWHCQIACSRGMLILSSLSGY
jgi:hypothetical protein